MPPGRRFCLFTLSGAASGPGSDYFIVWLKQPLGPAGVDLVVDAYDKGQLWRREEILELFGLEELTPASSREVNLRRALVSLCLQQFQRGDGSSFWRI